MRARNCICTLALGALALSVSVYAAPRDGATANGMEQARSDSVRLTTGSDAHLRSTADGAVAATMLWRVAPVAPYAGLSYPPGTTVDTAAGTMTSPGGGHRVWFEVFMSNFAGAGDGIMKTHQWTLGPDGALPAGLSRPAQACTDMADCTAAGFGIADGSAGAPMGDYGCVQNAGTECNPAFEEVTRANYPSSGNFSGGMNLPACNEANLACGDTIVGPPSMTDPGIELYMGTVVLDLGAVTGNVTLQLQNLNIDTFFQDGGGNTIPITKTGDAVIDIPTGRCCELDGTCTSDVTRSQCHSGPPFFGAGQLCPADGGPACIECTQDSECQNDAAGDCTTGACVSNFCVHTPIAGYVPGGPDCCNPVGGAIAPRADSDPCTTDSCDVDDAASLGAPQHPSAPDGTPCEEDPLNPCTYNDICTAGVCAGTLVDGEACDAGDCTRGGDTPGATCTGPGDTCECSLDVGLSFDVIANKKPKTDPVCKGGVNDGDPCASDDDCPGSHFCEGGENDGAPCDAGDLGACPGGACVGPNVPIAPGVCHGIVCFSEGEKIVVDVNMGASAVEITGGQFLVVYDTSCLSFNSIVPGGAPYTKQIMEQVDEVAGTIFYAVGVELGGTGEFGLATLATISFNKLGACGECVLCFNSDNPANTRLTDAEGQPVGVVPDCSNQIRLTPSIAINGPETVKVNTACDSATRVVTWANPVVKSDCEEVGLTLRGLHIESGLDFKDWAKNGGVFPVGNANFCANASNSCGQIAEHCWTVTVNDQTTLDVEVQLSPTMHSKAGLSCVGGTNDGLACAVAADCPGGACVNVGLRRCIKFEVFSNCIQPPLVFEQDMDFGGLWNLVAHFNGDIKIPSQIQPACITARDQLHTLRSCYLFGAGDCDADGVLHAAFKGDPFFAGNWLVGGNLDGWKKDNPNASHDVIDILDFGQMVAQWMTNYGTGNTPCGWSGANADINGDGLVDALDYSFVSMNFLEDSKDCCCPGSASLGNTTGRTSVTNEWLIRHGMKDLTVADLNNDGTVDLADMAALLQGVRPQRQAPERDGKGSSGARSFNR